MTAFMKLLLHFKQSHKVYLVWDDIIKTNRLSFPLLMNCCTMRKSIHFDMHKCIEVLFKMNMIKYKLRQHEIQNFSKSIRKLVTKCNDYHQLKLVQISFNLIMIFITKPH